MGTHNEVQNDRQNKESFFVDADDNLFDSAENTIAKVSSFLFTSIRPLTAMRLSELTDESLEDVESALASIQEMYLDEVHGFSLREISGAFQLRTSPSLAPMLRRLIPARARKLSKAAAETLAVVAYKQPVARADIEAIRGVDAIPTLKTLLDARLIRAIGREDTVGHPTLYGTTDVFLEKYGLKDLSELPSIRELAELENDPGEGSAGSSSEDLKGLHLVGDELEADDNRGEDSEDSEHSSLSSDSGNGEDLENEIGSDET